MNCNSISSSSQVTLSCPTYNTTLNTSQCACMRMCMRTPRICRTLHPVRYTLVLERDAYACHLPATDRGRLLVYYCLSSPDPPSSSSPLLSASHLPDFYSWSARLCPARRRMPPPWHWQPSRPFTLRERRSRSPPPPQTPRRRPTRPSAHLGRGASPFSTTPSTRAAY